MIACTILAIEAEARAAARKKVLDEIRHAIVRAGHEHSTVRSLVEIQAALDSLSTDTREEPSDG